MLKYLISTTNELRLESIEDVKKFHDELREEAKALGCTLANFSWTEKEDKKQETIYYQVKYKFTFGTLRAPEAELTDIKYDIVPTYTLEGIDE